VPKPPRRSTSRPVGGAAPRPGGAAVGTRPIRPKRIGRQPIRESFLQRNRTRLLWAGAAVVVVALGALFYLQATAPAYACGVEWTAPATPSPAPGESPAPGPSLRLGYAEEDMGRDHVATGTSVKYTYCPPASGSHYSATGQGPIDARVYGPNDRAIPEGWVHNLEHGALVLLYKCPGDACSDTGQAALQQLWANWPASPICHKPAHEIGPVIARFDDMAYPYAALVWDQILPLQTLDNQQILAFFSQQAERTNPEPQCAVPSAAPSAAPTTAPATNAPSPAASDLPSPSVAASAG
jgi:hypothetical protein